MKDYVQPDPNGPPSDIYSLGKQMLGGSRKLAALVACGLFILFGTYWLVFHPFRGEEDLLVVAYDAPGTYLNSICSAFMDDQTGGEGEILVQQAGSVQQAENIARGLVADVLLLASKAEMLQIGESARMLSPDWARKFPHGSSPYASTIVMVERVDNSNGIKDWQDLYDTKVRSVMPDPRTSGAGRYVYLALLADALEASGGDIRVAEAHVYNLMMRIRMLSLGAQSVTEVFLRDSHADVLLTWETEAIRLVNELAPGQFRIIYPSSSLLAEPVVAVMDIHTRKRSTEEAAQEFVEFLYSEKGQELAARAGFRPRTGQPHGAAMESIELKSIEAVFGDWDRVYEEHLGPGGSFSYAMRLRAAAMGGVE